MSQHYDDATQLLKDKTPKSQNYQRLSSLGNGQPASSKVFLQQNCNDESSQFQNGFLLPHQAGDGKIDNLFREFLSFF